ncbi:hypothetical protein GYMLUDRAFT_500761 [Collybiopsis luxurians FD-317 M1]|uniref:Uncharacterized protein n=1 Tax=Collybiopsis luxurians FD-317 M1 TaxID=944289 RepID=A0A0D0D0G3_9AGAR|nr:hypothetical protein GYMLUDRAFT_500761 [Collybiopsis luxurians FD-317 M1]
MAYVCGWNDDFKLFKFRKKREKKESERDVYLICMHQVVSLFLGKIDRRARNRSISGPLSRYQVMADGPVRMLRNLEIPWSMLPFGHQPFQDDSCFP